MKTVIVSNTSAIPNHSHPHTHTQALTKPTQPTTSRRKTPCQGTPRKNTHTQTRILSQCVRSGAFVCLWVFGKNCANESFAPTNECEWRLCVWACPSDSLFAVATTWQRSTTWRSIQRGQQRGNRNSWLQQQRWRCENHLFETATTNAQALANIRCH